MNSKTAASPSIPPQHTGKQVDLESRIMLPDEESAKCFLQLARGRLLDVNNWYATAEIPVASFVLADEHGGEAIRSVVAEGDKIRIDIPGPGPASGDGYDWVVVTDITELADQLYSITLQPTTNPLKLNDDTAHFFKDIASSTLVVERKGKEIIARYHGRNETVNTETDSTIDNVRNALVGVGAKLGLSYPQWKSLVEGLVKRP
ncbi:hypothetical protein [Parapedobacter pyrenivorans]|uniref:hypothetical protein n=1 Tax=Parapedobacter pyrenivorans TaxID=1305674 RepID=UPI003341AC5E